MRERRWVSWLAERAPLKLSDEDLAQARAEQFVGSRSSGRSIFGIGDDCALFPQRDHRGALACADMILDGTHFDSRIHLPAQIGHKALGVNLSDIAAMGGYASAALVTVALPKNDVPFDAGALFDGIFELAARHDVNIIGGDTNSWSESLAISVTVLGFAGRRLWCREGAQVGDRILVSGELGGSILGHHLDFSPRLDLAKRLNENYHISAAMDLSDGIAIDLNRLCEASGVGANVQMSQLPCSEAARTLAAKSGSPAHLHAMCDGEDFELLLTASDDVARAILDDQTLGCMLTDIGEVTQGCELNLIDERGRQTQWPSGGFEHDLGGPSHNESDD